MKQFQKKWEPVFRPELRKTRIATVAVGGTALPGTRCTRQNRIAVPRYPRPLRDALLAHNSLRLLSGILLCGLILCSASACTTSAPRPAPAPVIIDPQRPEPATPGIKPLTVEQEEWVGA